MILSKVEHIEHLRALSMGQRLLYTLSLSVIVATAFIATNLLAILIAILWHTIKGALSLSLEDILELSLPITAAFIAAMAFTSNPVSVGQPLRKTAIRAARFGLKNGLISGLIFGMILSFISGLWVVRYERWDLLFGPEIITFGVELGLVVSPAMALYRGLTSVIETVILNFITGRRNAAA